MDSKAIQQSERLGRQAAEALYGKRDSSLCRHFTAYQSKFVFSHPAAERGELVRAFNRGYQAVSADYASARPLAL